MPAWTCVLLVLPTLGLGIGRASAQSDPDACGPYALTGTVLECAATGSPRDQLRAGTFIAGSVATGEMLAQSVGIEVATTPLGSSSGGFTYTFDAERRAWTRTSSTFGPAFSERALTIGKQRISAGFNVLARRYDEVDGLDLHDFAAFRFEGGSLAASVSEVELEVQADTIAAFVHYGLLDNLDVSVFVPYVRVSMTGISRILGQADEELQRVRLSAANSGIGDIAISGKYRFWQLKKRPPAAEPDAALALAVTARLPTGDEDELLGLGVGRTLVSLIGSATLGRYSPHVNVGYEFWTASTVTPRDFQGNTSLSIKDQVQYTAGFEYELHPRLTLMADVLGRYLRGGGQVGYQPFRFPQNRSNVQGAEALVAIPGGFHTVVVAPGAKWNFYRAALLTGNVLISVTDGGLRDRVTPVLGIDWGF